MSNQDPLQPQDNSAMIAQLAQFSSLEQAQNTNDKLDQLLLAQASSNQIGQAALIGKQVTYNTSTITLDSSGAPDLKGHVDAAGTVTAKIIDSTGAVVRTVSATESAAGDFTIPWDGKDSKGVALPAGSYTITYSAVDANKGAVNVTSQGTGVVTGLDYSAGYGQLVINGTKVKMTDVKQVNQAPTTPTTTPAA
jgi:flagellar basal-body rod modification protein FlgD